MSNDTLIGNAGDNVLLGGDGDDILIGGEGDDILIGGERNNTLDGGAGSDTASYVTARAGVTVNLSLTGAQDTGGAGTDTLRNLENLTGSAFDDILIGNAGDNVLLGGEGNDTLNSRAGNDTLDGGGGNDILNGGAGNDTLSSGSGLDRFVFNTALNALTNKDVISDFSVLDDTLVLDNAIFTKFTATGAIAPGTLVVRAEAVADDSNDFLLYDTSTGILSYDADGNGAGAAVAFVTLLGIPALTSADITII